MGDPCLNLNPSPRQSQAIAQTVLLLAARENAALPWQEVLIAAGFGVQTSLPVGALQALQAAAVEVVAIVWLQSATPAPDGEPDLPIILLERLQAMERDRPVLLVGDRVEPTALAECFRVGLADYLPADRPEQLPPALQRILAARAERAADLQRRRAIEGLVGRLQGTTVLAEVLQEIVDWLRGTLAAETCWLSGSELRDRPWRIQYLAAASARGDEPGLGSFDPFVPHYRQRLERGQLSYVPRTEWPAAMQTLSSLQSIEAVLLVPLQYDGRCWGALCLLQGCQLPQPWSAADLTQVQNAALHGAIALHRDDCLRQLQREKQELIDASETSPHSESFATMSHEIRAPLANILGFARMLRDCHYGPLNERQQQYVNSLCNCSEYLLALLNNLLDLSKIEADREELNWEAIPIENICHAALELVSSKAQERGLALELQIAPELTVCYADRLRLQQILVNLLSNAVKFTPEGSVSLQVGCSDGEILFSVIDTGIGITAADLQTLFQPFQQVRAARKSSEPGTGLGLVLSLRLAQLHGGDITAVSEPQRGSCFTFRLPTKVPEYYDDRPDS